MIINFSIENWMSFRDRVSFSMVASPERQHSERLPSAGKYATRILPVAAIYGGNASGKTNLFKALSFAREFVVDGAKPDVDIRVEPFRLAAANTMQPTRFSFELLIDETIYEFSFSLTRKAVVEERLVRISSSGETVLYDRKNGQPGFDRSLDKNQFLHYAFQGTRDNQLFLTNSVSQRVENFRPVYDWFKDKLELIAPDSRFGPIKKLLDEGHPMSSAISSMLPQLDTGITHLGAERVSLSELFMPEEIKAQLQDSIKEGKYVSASFEPEGERFIFTKKDGELIAERMVAYHPSQDGGEVRFFIGEESDGSKRILDLLPVFVGMCSSERQSVHIIDEIDRSLHPLLIRALLEFYLGACSSESRVQLLFTTHNTQIMDQHLFRRDEMWVAERDGTGASSLFSFSGFKDVRYDKDIRKSYLQGRLGGIPRIRLGGVLSCPVPDQANSEDAKLQAGGEKH
jgi:AAA15 family ATPase/GTPase